MIKFRKFETPQAIQTSDQIEGKTERKQKGRKFLKLGVNGGRRLGETGVGGNKVVLGGKTKRCRAIQFPENKVSVLA